MTALTPEQIKQRLRYQGKQYSAGAFARGGAPERHYLEQAADRIQELENALSDCADDYNAEVSGLSTRPPCYRADFDGEKQ